MKRDDRLLHIATGRLATVVANRQAGKPNVRVTFDGNRSPQYVAAIEFTPAPADASIATILGERPPKAQPMPPATHGGSNGEANERIDHRLDRAIRAGCVPGYGGDITLQVLEARLGELKHGVAKLEIAVAAIRTREVLRAELQRIGFKGDANDRAAVAADALRYGRDTDKLVAAVDRLSKKGAL